MSWRVRRDWEGGAISILFRRFRLPILLVGLALVYGTVGYIALEQFTLLESLYQTVTTLTTVGFQEVHPLSDGARVFTLTLIAFGVIALFDLVGAFGALLASGDLEELLNRRRMRHRVEHLKGHYVVCAYGRVGRAATRELLHEGADVVVVEVKAELESQLQEADIPYLIADPSEESVLLQAGIERAAGLVCAVDSDAINVFITLTARALNPGLFIVARAAARESVDKLERAGANRIVSPYSLSGTRMAALALRPAVVDFVDMVTLAPNQRLEEIIVQPGSVLDGTSLRDACSPYPEVAVLAVKKKGGDLLVSPSSDTVLGRGDLVIVLGPTSDLAPMANRAV